MSRYNSERKTKISKDRELQLSEDRKKPKSPKAMMDSISKFSIDQVESMTSYERIKDNRTIVIIRKKIKQLKEKYQMTELNEYAKEIINENIQDAREIKKNKNILQFNTEKYISKMIKILHTNKWYPEEYFEEAKKIIIPEAYHLIGNPKEWFSFYITKDVYVALMNEIFDEAWYCRYEGSVGIGIIGKSNTKEEKEKSDYVAVDQNIMLDDTLSNLFGTSTTKEESKTKETSKTSIQDNSKKITKSDSEGYVSINEGNEFYNGINENVSYTRQLQTAILSKKGFQTRMDCHLYAGYESPVEGNVILDLSKPGILKGTETIKQGMMTYSFRGAAANMFMHLRRVTGSKSGNIKGLSDLPINQIQEMFNTNKAQVINDKRYEDTFFFEEEEQPKRFLEYNGGRLQSNTPLLTNNTTMNMMNITEPNQMVNNQINENRYQEVETVIEYPNAPTTMEDVD